MAKAGSVAGQRSQGLGPKAGNAARLDDGIAEAVHAAGQDRVSALAGRRRSVVHSAGDRMQEALALVHGGENAIHGRHGELGHYIEVTGENIGHPSPFLAEFGLSTYPIRTRPYL